MIGLGLLLIAGLYICIVVAGSRKFKKNKLGLAIYWSLVILFPTWFFIGHKLYPSYHQFQALCEANDRKEIFETKAVDYLYLGRASSCERGLNYLNFYKGIECTFAPKEDNEPGAVKGLFRFSRGKSWTDSSCSEQCSSKPQKHEESECYLACSEKKIINSISNPYVFDYTRTPLVKKRLYLRETSMLENEEVLARSRNYTYYPFGEGAKMLNLSAGSAPYSNCDSSIFINVTDVFIPNNEKKAHSD
ncbi:hypothetical protein [Aliikangiella coralliicola]|uniref:Uncharacterized protein n=1 Tax=Aliikangiella coralliicola TaxID=2592383 RepID=A0A545UFM5_9GAMM|nr:hypothetical protein [Aliikangiella coralliicola]TQV88270.1 hypothetical protein FLL46_07010 [Aliikangiella coralliicola]